MGILVAILSLATGPATPLGRLSFPNKAAWCRRHGYGFIAPDSVPDDGRHPYWAKLRLLLTHLDRYDWLFWSDADSLILNPDVRLESLIDPEADLVISREHNPHNDGGVNTGQFLVRGNDRSRAFLECVYGQTQFLAHPYPEQAAMDHVLRERLVPIRVREVPKRTLNGDPRDYQAGDFMMHYLGHAARAWMMRRQLLTMPQDQGGRTVTPEERAHRLKTDVTPRAVAARPTPARPIGAPPPGLGEVFRRYQSGDKAGAEEDCRALLARHPGDPSALHLLGLILSELGRHDEAFEALANALEAAPHVPDFHANLGAALARLGYLKEAEPLLRRAVEFDARNAHLHSSLLFVLNHDPDTKAAQLAAEHVAWAERHADSTKRWPMPPERGSAADRDPGRRLRVGYVSPDLRDHACARFIEPLLAHHDPAETEVYCYSDTKHADEVTRRLRAYPNVTWRDTAGTPDALLAWRVAMEDRIDVLVDLAGHTCGGSGARHCPDGAKGRPVPGPSLAREGPSHGATFT